jgi:hypothetical protein
MIEDRARALLTFALQLWLRPADSVVDALETAKVTSAAFHPECVRRVEHHLRIQLSKVSQTKYESDTSHARIVCAVSAEHGETSGIPYYWFAFHQSQLEFLSASDKPFVCLGCGSAARIVLMPLKVLQASLGSLSMTRAIIDTIGTSLFRKKEDQLLLKLLGGGYGPDLTEYNISTVPVAN